MIIIKQAKLKFITKNKIFLRFFIKLWFCLFYYLHISMRLFPSPNNFDTFWKLAFNEFLIFNCQIMFFTLNFFNQRIKKVMMHTSSTNDHFSRMETSDDFSEALFNNIPRNICVLNLYGVVFKKKNGIVKHSIFLFVYFSEKTNNCRFEKSILIIILMPNIILIFRFCIWMVTVGCNLITITKIKTICYAKCVSLFLFVKFEDIPGRVECI